MGVAEYHLLIGSTWSVGWSAMPAGRLHVSRKVELQTHMTKFPSGGANILQVNSKMCWRSDIEVR